MSWTSSEIGMRCWRILRVPKGARFVDRSVRYLGAVDRNARWWRDIYEAINGEWWKLDHMKYPSLIMNDWFNNIYTYMLLVHHHYCVVKRLNGTEVLISSCLRRDWNGYSLLKLLRRVRLGSCLLIALEKSLAAMWPAKESDLKFQELNTAHLWKIMSIPWYSMV